MKRSIALWVTMILVVAVSLAYSETRLTNWGQMLASVKKSAS